MKLTFFLLFFTCSFLNACDSSKKVKQSANDLSNLSGNWELNRIVGSTVNFNELFPDKKPNISFNFTNNSFNGHTGCNNFNGSFTAHGNAIRFNDPFAMTKMFCPGNGEQVFIELLKKVNGWVVSETKELKLLMDNQPILQLSGK